MTAAPPSAAGQPQQPLNPTQLAGLLHVLMSDQGVAAAMVRRSSANRHPNAPASFNQAWSWTQRFAQHAPFQGPFDAEGGADDVYMLMRDPQVHRAMQAFLPLAHQVLPNFARMIGRPGLPDWQPPAAVVPGHPGGQPQHQQQRQQPRQPAGPFAGGGAPQPQQAPRPAAPPQPPPVPGVPPGMDPQMGSAMAVMPAGTKINPSTMGAASSQPNPANYPGGTSINANWARVPATHTQRPGVHVAAQPAAPPTMPIQAQHHQPTYPPAPPATPVPPPGAPPAPGGVAGQQGFGASYAHPAPSPGASLAHAPLEDPTRGAPQPQQRGPAAGPAPGIAQAAQPPGAAMAQVQATLARVQAGAVAPAAPSAPPVPPIVAAAPGAPAAPAAPARAVAAPSTPLGVEPGTVSPWDRLGMPMWRYANVVTAVFCHLAEYGVARVAWNAQSVALSTRALEVGWLRLTSPTELDSIVAFLLAEPGVKELVGRKSLAGGSDMRSFKSDEDFKQLLGKLVASDEWSAQVMVAFSNKIAGPATELGERLGLLSIVGRLVVADAFRGGLVSATLLAVADVQTPAKDGDEAAFLKAWLTARKPILESANKPVGTTESLLAIVESGNLALDCARPVDWTDDRGDTHPVGESTLLPPAPTDAAAGPG